MSARSGIEWTDATWNPLRGCSRVSEGCRHCYAERVAARFSGPGLPYEGLARMVGRGARWTGEVRFIEELLDVPLRWRKPRRVFVNSMSDLFHEKVPDDTLDEILAVMVLARALGRGHTFQVLTKRPQRMLEYFTGGPATADGWAERLSAAAARSFSEEYSCHVANSVNGVLGDGRNAGWPIADLWLGVSVEHQPAVDERIPALLETPAAVRFLSCEPLLGPLDLLAHVAFDRSPGGGFAHAAPVEVLDWIIVGGESGPGARPMHPAWARSLRDQCVVAGIPFFFKQWGEFAPIAPVYPDDVLGDVDEALHDCDGDKLAAVEPSGAVPQFGDRCDYQPCPGSWWMELVGKKRAGRELDGRTWDEMPAAPAAVAA